MFCSVSSLGLLGIESYGVQVEVDSRRGMPGFDIVGLPDAAVKESRERIRSAVQNLGYAAPASRVVANLAPANTKKQGSVYDLPLLLGLIQACGYETFRLDGTAVIGEIGLSGEVRGVTGVLPMVLDAAALGYSRVVVPLENAGEARVARGVEVLASAHAGEVIAWAAGRGTLPPAGDIPLAARPEAPLADLRDVRGQEEARRALEIAAAGGHNLLLIGPPGSGKSMLAKRLPSILPPMTEEEAVQTTKLYSVAGELLPGQSLLSRRTFRSPHHTASPASLTGGGSSPRPGDLSLAHNGVLFLDELPEFPRNTLEVLRQPLEDGLVHLSRVRQRVTYPGRAMLVCAMNPCPCGQFGQPGNKCTCSPAALHRYLGRVSGPLLDRIDLHVEVPAVEYRQISSRSEGESSAAVRERVCAARERQAKRYRGAGISCNALLPSAMLREACSLEAEAERLLQAAFQRMHLSARGYGRILKVARTIADLENSERIRAPHIAQAVQLRSLDRKYWDL